MPDDNNSDEYTRALLEYTLALTSATTALRALTWSIAVLAIVLMVNTFVAIRLSGL